MTRAALALASIMLVAACGRPTATATVAPSRLAPADALQCALSTFKTLGFQRTMLDEDELRTSARKENPNFTVSNTNFRKAWDRLDIDVQAGTTGTQMEVMGFSEAEYFSQNGKTLERLKPSPEVLKATEEMKQRCGTAAPVSNDSVPPAAQ